MSRIRNDFRLQVIIDKSDVLTWITDVSSTGDKDEVKHDGKMILFSVS